MSEQQCNYRNALGELCVMGIDHFGGHVYSSDHQVKAKLCGYVNAYGETCVLRLGHIGIHTYQGHVHEGGEPVVYPKASAVLNLDAAVGPDAPAEIKPNGAKQSATPFRFDLLPWLAISAVAELAKEGADKYGENNWRQLTVEDNLNHSMMHGAMHLAGNRAEGPIGHLTRHAFRAVMALELAIEKETKQRLKGEPEECRRQPSYQKEQLK